MSNDTTPVAASCALTAGSAIDPRSTVNDVLLRHPAAVKVFAALGVHTCCGGGATLDAAARDAGIATDVLLAALEGAIPAEVR